MHCNNKLVVLITEGLPWLQTSYIQRWWLWEVHFIGASLSKPHTSPTSHPPDVIHVIGVPRHSPFFALFHFRVLYWTKTKEQKRGRPGNEAMYSLSSFIDRRNGCTKYCLPRSWNSRKVKNSAVIQGLCAMTLNQQCIARSGSPPRW